MTHPSDIIAARRRAAHAMGQVRRDRVRAARRDCEWAIDVLRATRRSIRRVEAEIAPRSTINTQG